MGQVISITLRCLGEEVKKDEADNNPLISHPEEPSYCLNIDMDEDVVNTLQEKLLLDMPSSESHQGDLHSSVAYNSSILCLNQESETICSEEIKDVIVNQQEAPGDIKQADDGNPENMDFIDSCSIEKVITKEIMTEERTEERRKGPYTSSQKILLVGEGDFSFAAALAEAFGSAVNMLATSLDSRGFLSKNYRRRALNNISKLTDRGCIVLHNVDCTKMVDLFSSMRFDRIIYNFPHAGFCNRDEPHESQLCRHRTLVSLFLANAKELVKEDGEIHITHKSNGFFLQWDLKSLASEEGLLLLEEIPFCRKDYPGYRTMCGFGGNNFFFCRPCKTYKFGHPSTSIPTSMH